MNPDGTRERILDATVYLISKRGFDEHGGFAGLARKFGTTEAAMVRMFGTKEQFLETLVETGRNRRQSCGAW